MPEAETAGPEGGADLPRSAPEPLTAREALLLSELARLGRTIAIAKVEIAALHSDALETDHIPGATNELDAIVRDTGEATNAILDWCEVLERLQERQTPADAILLGEAVTHIYEACSFQDITGQRIGKVVRVLQAIEAGIAALAGRADGGFHVPVVPAAPPAESLSEGRALAHGPQRRGMGVSQQEIDRLLADLA